MDISERLTLWQKKYLSRIKTLPEETQLIYIIAMDAVYELMEQEAEKSKSIMRDKAERLYYAGMNMGKWFAMNTGPLKPVSNPPTMEESIDDILGAKDDPDAFGKAIVEELRINWACDTETALMILNGAERRMKK